MYILNRIRSERQLSRTVGYAGILLCSLLYTGCAVKMDAPDKKVQTPQVPQSPVVNLKEEWEESNLSRGNAKIQLKSLKSQFREEMRRKFKVPELEEVKSEHSGSFTLFRVKNYEEAKGTVFIQPKIFVYGTAQGGNVLSITNRDGSMMTLTIPISFVDGQRQTIPSYEGRNAVPLPEALRIPNVQTLRDDLRSKLGSEIQLQALPSCPRDLSLIHIKGAKTDRLLLKPTIAIQKRCPMNEFFTASVTSSREEITRLIENALDDGLGVQIATRFKVEYRQPVVVYSLNLNPRGVYEKIRERLIANSFGGGGESTIYLAHQIIFPMQDLLGEEIGQTGVNPAWVPYSQGVQILQDTFFDDISGTEGCPAPNHCFRVKRATDVNFDGPIELMWVEEETLGSSDLIPSVSMVKGLAESYPLRVSSERGIPMLSIVPSLQACQSANNSLPGCPGFSCSAFPENVYCRDGKTKADVNQFQVFPGAKLKLSFSRATEWGYELPLPRNDTSEDQKKGVLKCADSRVIPGACLEYENICPEKKVDHCPKPDFSCDNTKDVFEEHCYDEEVKESNCGFLGWGRCSEVLKERKHTCEQKKIGTQCLHFKETCLVNLEKECPVQEIRQCKTPIRACEQYTTEFYSKYTFSEPWVRPRSLDLDQGETIQELWSGLDIEFVSLQEDGRSFNRVVCPLLAFPHQMQGHHTLTVTINNQEGTGCQPFNDWNRREGRWPSIAVINHINYSKSYRCGALEWTHAVSSDPKSLNNTVDRLLYSCPETGEQSSNWIIRNYQPILDLYGTISILGRSIDTVSAGNPK